MPNWMNGVMPTPKNAEATPPLTPSEPGPEPDQEREKPEGDPRHGLQNAFGNRLRNVRPEHRPDHAAEANDGPGRNVDVAFAVVGDGAGDGHHQHRRQGRAHRLVDGQAEGDGEQRHHDAGATRANEAKEHSDGEACNDKREEKCQEPRSRSRLSASSSASIWSGVVLVGCRMRGTSTKSTSGGSWAGRRDALETSITVDHVRL